jgi:hypothetical protein
MSVVFGTFGLSLVLCNPSNNNKFSCLSMMEAPCTCHVGWLSHSQWINDQRQRAWNAMTKWKAAMGMLLI